MIEVVAATTMAGSGVRTDSRPPGAGGVKLVESAEPTVPYGQELILDLHGCNVAKFTREGISAYCTALCELIGMEPCELHFWDDVGVPEHEKQTHPKTKGTSAVQFILTSSIVIHTLELMQVAYVNIFSCEEFDADVATDFTACWFGSTRCSSNIVIRS